MTPPRRIIETVVTYNKKEEIVESQSEEPSFGNLSNLRNTFVRRLRNTDIRAKLACHCIDLLITGAIDGEGEVLETLSESLDFIERGLSEESEIQEESRFHRTYFGGWRNLLFHQSQSLGNLKRAADYTEGVQEISNLHSFIIADLLEYNAVLTQRVEGTYQILLSSVQMIESEKAISQAETVSKLTQLAFFFIPLTLVTGIFGMNIVVSMPSESSIADNTDSMNRSSKTS